MHGLAHGLVAAEGERQVRHAARDVHVRQLRLDLARRLDEGDAVGVVLLDAGGDGEDVGVEDDVLGRKADLLGQQLVGALADRHLARDGVGLALLVERHHHHGGAVAQHLPGVVEEGVLALLHADGVDDRLALHALEARLDHAPLGAVDHHGHAGDVGLGGDQVEERHHRLLGIEQALVHVDVEDLRAVLDLASAQSRARRRSRPASISLRNLAEPVTLVRSPMLMNDVAALVVAVIAIGLQPQHRLSSSGLSRGSSSQSSAGASGWM